MKTTTIRQTVTFQATPQEVYEALMDPAQHARFTGSKARISRKVGGRFSAYDGGLTGTHLSLVPGKRIVQLWRCDMDGWPRTHLSRATFSFTKVRNGTRMVFVHTGVPAACAKDIANGWRQYYWEPMKAMLAGG